MSLGKTLIKNNESIIQHEKKVAAEMVNGVTDYLTDYITKGLAYPVRFKSTSISYDIFIRYGLPSLNEWLKKEELQLVSFNYDHPYATFEVTCL